MREKENRRKRAGGSNLNRLIIYDMIFILCLTKWDDWKPAVLLFSFISMVVINDLNVMCITIQAVGRQNTRTPFLRFLLVNRVKQLCNCFGKSAIFLFVYFARAWR